jgi:hypothetical protein
LAQALARRLFRIGNVATLNRNVLPYLKRVKGFESSTPTSVVDARVVSGASPMDTGAAGFLSL